MAPEKWCPVFRQGLASTENRVKRKGRPEGRPFCEFLVSSWLAQFAALAGGLSVADGAAVAVALMPCRRSTAVFSALSSLASGGT